MHAHEIDELIQRKITHVELVDLTSPDTLHSEIVLNCFKEEDAKYTSEGLDEPSKEDVLTPIFTVLMPGEMVAVDRAEKDLPDMFFSPRKYDLGAVGRYKFNKKFGSENDSTEVTTLQPQDIVNTMSYLVQVFIRKRTLTISTISAIVVSVPWANCCRTLSREPSPGWTRSLKSG